MADAAPTPATAGAKPQPEQAPTTAAAAAAPVWLAELPARPIVKKPRLPPGARIVSRRLNLMCHRLPQNLTRANQHLASKRRIDLLPGTEIVAVLRRVQKLLDKSPRGVLGQKLPLPLLPSGPKQKAGKGGGAKSLAPSSRAFGGGADAAGKDDEPQVAAYGERFDALVIGSGGKNIEKALKVAASFQRRGDCVVRLYTSTATGIDTYEVDGEEDDDQDADMRDEDGNGDMQAGKEKGVGRVLKQRVRKASSLEVGIRLK